jgi:ribulose-phosphate 3-epimerase
MPSYSIAPSLLSANFARLGEEAQAVIAAGADLLHFDVMDNHYVPNLTVGPLVCAALRKFGISTPIDVHLMVKPVDHLIVEFAKAGASQISFHPEASLHVDRSIELIKSHGLKAGLALNPGTTLHCLEYVLDKLDFILIMSVNPGYAGQAFIPESLKKIQQLRTMLAGRTMSIAIDGGVNLDNIQAIAKAGADTFVAGSAIFSKPPYVEIIKQFRQKLMEV